MEEQGASPTYDLPASAPVPPVEPASPGRVRSGRGWIWFIVAVIVLLASVATCSFFAFLGTTASSKTGWSGGDAVALIHLDGAIAGTGSTYQGTITPEYFIGQLKQAEEDPAVRAILIRADSPGGTAAASQEISIEVSRLSKPVVVSVGDMCASGAYMIASQADEIVATPTSSVGSIGVIASIPNIEGLLDKLGIDFQVLTAGEYKDAGSMFRSLTETETALYNEYLDEVYREFIRIVAEGRGLSEAEVEKMATGWVWSGNTALEMGLVDSVGTFSDALDLAAELGGIEGTPRVVTYTESDYNALLRSLMGLGTGIEQLGTLDPGADALRRAVPH